MTDKRINEPDAQDGAPCFQRDLGRGVADLVRARGFKVADDAEVEDVMVMYLNSRFREIPTAPRRVHWSRELRTRADLDRRVLDGIRRIEAASARGEPLSRYQSTTLLDARYADKLFNEWRIHHFHLDLPDGKPTRPGFGKRTSELLFLMVTPGELLLIDVRNHDAFVDKDLFEIVHRNWPECISKWRLEGVSEADVLDHAWARKARISIVTVLSDGAVYAPLGGGTLFDRRGTALVVGRESDKWRNRAQQLQEACLRNVEQVRKNAATIGRSFDQPRFRLRVTEKPGLWTEALHLEPYEEETNIGITFRSPSSSPSPLTPPSE